MNSGSVTHARYQALLQLLRTADTIWNASRLFFAPWGLSPSQFNVLNLLFGVPDGLSQTELGRHLIVHKSAVTGLVDRLQKRGLVGRKTVTGDRRAYRVVLTTKGNELMSRIVPEYHLRAAEVLGHLDGTQAAEFGRLLREAARNGERLVTASNRKEQ
jgi:DNA-binding MarR family transcriptional regulator